MLLTFLNPQLGEKNHSLPQIVAILIASLGAISKGLLFSWTSPSVLQLVASNSTTLEEASYFTVISPISMAIAAPLLSALIDVIGRKNGVLLVALPQLIAWILTYIAENIWVFYLAVFFTGIGNAAVYVIIPVYVCEIAEPKVRGTWGNAVSISIYLGVFLMNVIGAYNDIKVSALICGCLPVIQVLLFCWMPESPYYLLMKDREDEARKALRLLRWRNDVEEELLTLKADVARQISESGTWKELWTIVSNRKSLIMCVGMRIAQQFSGVPVVEMYAQYLFQQAGGDISHDLSAMTVSGTLALSVTLSALFVDKFGRKTLMIFSSLGCALILTAVTIYFFLIEFTRVDLSNFGWLPLVGMLGYTIICATGLAILPTLISGEVFSASIKGKAGGITNTATAVCFLIIPKLFHVLTSRYSIFSPYCLFTISCYAGAVFSYFYVIETKGKTLEQIQQAFKGNKKQNQFVKC